MELLCIYSAMDLEFKNSKLAISVLTISVEVNTF